MRLFQFLMQDETFPISHARWDFPDFSCRMRLFGFLMLHETFCPKDETNKQKKNTLLRPLHYVLAVKNTWNSVDYFRLVLKVCTVILYSVSKWRENNASATRRIDDDGKVLKKIPLSLVQVGAYILRTVDRVSYWPSDSKKITKSLCKVLER